jgi:hypothetical protein
MMPDEAGPAPVGFLGGVRIHLSQVTMNVKPALFSGSHRWR